ncbi:MAG: class I SAM-dependent methyltransferase [Candidatus Eisenbacteria bacterium]|nr:class I SAM-dependent methyltransferase [Candidatus Eisenbacteria bacterium]
MDVREFNQRAWDRQVERGNRWTVPVGPDVIADARAGRWQVLLTPTRAVPREWFGPLAGRDLLALASGGGQQAPVFAAAGANVTLLDNSPAQLARDREVAARDGLAIRLEQGDMRDLSRFADGSFDVVFHPASNAFVPDVGPVWRECFRVLRPGGRLLAGWVQPALYLFDDAEVDRGEFVARYPLPYSDLEAYTAERLARMEAEGEPLSFGHTLEQQVGGQLEAGFVLAALYEDRWPEHPLDRLLAPLVATLAIRPPA